MTDCIFCKIASGEIPSIKVYEDNDFLAFQALGQANPGHTLLIPKEHSMNFLEVQPEIARKMNEIAQKIGRAMLKGLKADGLNFVTNINSAGGQEVFHTHIHIIPRFEGDGLKFPPLQERKEEERILYAEKIIKELE